MEYPLPEICPNIDPLGARYTTDRADQCDGAAISAGRTRGRRIDFALIKTSILWASFSLKLEHNHIKTLMRKY
jgi:hypothetical protein